MSNFATVGVVGAGLMGSGIAAKLAVAGIKVRVYDVSISGRERLPERCAATFAELVQGGLFSTADAEMMKARVTVVDRIEDLAPLELVFEAIFESLTAKRALYDELENCLPASSIIASTTSAYMPDILAQQMKRQDRFLVAHFWNSPHLIPLVEVVPGAAAADRVVEDVTAFLRSAQCSPVLLKKPLPGFIGNRIQFAVLREALHMLREEVADAKTIDFVIKQTLGRRYPSIGPLEGADLGGLDTFLAISTHLMPVLAKDQDSLELLRAHTDRNERGRSSGRGFYCWDAAREEWLKTVRLAMLQRGSAESFAREVPA